MSKLIMQLICGVILENIASIDNRNYARNIISQTSIVEMRTAKLLLSYTLS